MTTIEDKQNSIDTLMQRADDMASAATTFNCHGYELFIEARKQMRETLELEFNKSETL